MVFKGSGLYIQVVFRTGLTVFVYRLSYTCTRLGVLLTRFLANHIAQTADLSQNFRLKYF